MSQTIKVHEELENTVGSPTDTFTLSNSPAYPESVEVFVSGLLQPPDSYTITANTIQFNTAIELNWPVVVTYEIHTDSSTTTQGYLVGGGSTWRDKIRYVVDGTPVDEAHTNPALIDLNNNIKYVKGLVETATLGNYNVSAYTALADDVAVGTPVYLDSSSV